MPARRPAVIGRCDGQRDGQCDERCDGQLGQSRIYSPVTTSSKGQARLLIAATREL
jgi:hypothetical protein